MATVSQSLYDHLPLALQELLVSAAGWRSFHQRYGSPFQYSLSVLQRTDFRTADEVRTDQDQRLRATIEWAARTVPYYRDLFKSEGVDPNSIRGVDDLERIPMLSKSTVRERGTSLRSEGVARRRMIPARTSGTTGTALQLMHTRESMGWEYAVILRQRGWFGISLRDRFAAFGGQTVVPLSQKAPPYWRYDRSGARMMFSLYHMSPETACHYALELHNPVYRFWQGYPSSMGLICQHLEDVGVELGDAAPIAVFTSSETLLDFHRNLISQVTGAPIADRYGNAEFCVSALQCPEGRYHVDTEFCVIEIEPHEETEDFVRGEVIATGFANRAMPFIRYRTGDVATLLKKERCGCGRARPILEKIDGRIEDYVVTPDGRRVGRLDHVFKDAHEVREAQIVQPDPSTLTVRIVPGSSYGPDAEARIDAEFRSRLGDAIDIHYEIHDSLEREPNGKFRAVLSSLPEGSLRPEVES